MATVVYRCSKVITRLSENKSGLQTKTEGNTSTIRGKQRNKHKLLNLEEKLKRKVPNQMAISKAQKNNYHDNDGIEWIFYNCLYHKRLDITHYSTETTTEK